MLGLTRKERPKDGVKAKFNIYHGRVLAYFVWQGYACVALDPRVINVSDKINAP
jgi:hypothetical protein